MRNPNEYSIELNLYNKNNPVEITRFFSVVFDTNKVNFVSQGIFRIHMAGLSFNNANWGYVLTVFRVFTLGTGLITTEYMIAKPLL